jgi:hypothetical protein
MGVHFRWAHPDVEQPGVVDSKNFVVEVVVVVAVVVEKAKPDLTVCSCLGSEVEVFLSLSGDCPPYPPFLGVL